MENYKMGYESLLETAEKLDSQIEYIKECIEEAGCWYISTDEEDEDNQMFIMRKHEVISVIDFDDLTISVNYPEMIFRGAYSNMLSKIAESLLEIKELLEDDIEDDTENENFITVESGLVCDKAIENLNFLVEYKDNFDTLHYNEFMEILTEDLTSEEIEDIESTFDVSDNLYSHEIYEDCDSEIILDSFDSEHEGYEFNHLLGVWIHTGNDETKYLNFLHKVNSGVSFTIDLENGDITYIDDDVDEDSVVDLFNLQLWKTETE